MGARPEDKQQQNNFILQRNNHLLAMSTKYANQTQVLASILVLMVVIGVLIQTLLVSNNTEDVGILTVHLYLQGGVFAISFVLWLVVSYKAYLVRIIASMIEMCKI